MKSQAAEKAHEANEPFIDNNKQNKTSSQAEIIHDMNIKLNTLMALMTDNQDPEDNSSMETGTMETETIEDGEIDEDILNPSPKLLKNKVRQSTTT